MVMEIGSRTGRRMLLSGTRALVIDGDLRDAWGLATTLRRLGFRARLEGDGQHMLSLLPAASFDWLFCDVTAKCELETIRRVHRDQPSIRVVALVRGGKVEDLANAAYALEQGADDFLVKPIQTECVALIVLALKSFGARR